MYLCSIVTETLVVIKNKDVYSRTLGNGLIEFDEFVVLMTKKLSQEGTEKDIMEAFKVLILMQKENLKSFSEVHLVSVFVFTALAVHHSALNGL